MATVVKCHDSAVAQRQLNLSLTLLTCYFARHRTVNLVGQPVFAGYGFKRENIAQIGLKIVFVVFRIFVCHIDGIVGHHGLR